MLGALELNYGNVRKSAKMTKINILTHYRWLKEDHEYSDQAENIADIGFRNIKDDLLDLSMRIAEKGNVSVLNKLLGIYFKNVPEEMKMISRINNFKTRVKIKWVNTPQDPTRTDHLLGKEEYERRLMSKEKE